MDAQDRYWFAEYRGNNAAMFDTRTGMFREWPLPHAYTYPYTSSAPDTKGRVYLPSNMSERLIRLDPASGQITEYLVPTAFDSKKVLHDPTAKRITLWLNNKRTARLLRVEPLD
jgi:streptogramin lyase